MLLNGVTKPQVTQNYHLSTFREFFGLFLEFFEGSFFFKNFLGGFFEDFFGRNSLEGILCYDVKVI